jgi:hypothetical protein
MVQALASDLELAKLTSLVVAAHCRSQHVEANKLPEIIATVNETLRAQYTPSGQATLAPGTMGPPGRERRLRARSEHPTTATSFAEHAPDTPPLAVRAASDPRGSSVQSGANVVYPSAFRRQVCGSV